jgi:hypothetical protein
MTKEIFVKEIIKANFHKGGIKCLETLLVKDGFFRKLQQEILQIKDLPKSDVRDTAHVSNPVTKPSGENFQYSLFNESGKTEDYSKDWNKSAANKKFHFAGEYPYMNHFIQSFEGCLNMKLLVLGPGTELFPHEAHLVVPTNPPRLVLRFHLPIFTNEKCLMLLDGETFHFKEQHIYFFNEGCIHSAWNKSDSYRYHLSWDMYLDDSVYQLMFSDDGVENKFFQRKNDPSEKRLEAVEEIKIKDYMLQGKNRAAYDKLSLEKLGIGQPAFNKVYNEVAYWSFKFNKQKKMRI